MEKLTFRNLQHKGNELPLTDGRRIKGGEVFQASLSAIPLAFRDLIEQLPSGAPVMEDAVIVEETKEVAVEVKETKEVKEQSETEVETALEIEMVEKETKEETDLVIETVTYSKPLRKRHTGGGRYEVYDAKGEIVASLVTSIKADQIIKQFK